MPRHSSPITEVSVRGRTRWRVVVSITRDGRRSRVSRTVDTREEAERIYAQAKLGEVLPSSRDTFDAWADKWILRKEDSGVRPNTLAGYRSDLTHPRAAFGGARIQDLGEDRIEALVRSMRDAGASKRTTGKMLTTLRSVFDLAVRKNVLRFNPAAGVEALGRPPVERDALTVKELEAIRKAIRGDDYEACWMLTLAGLRRSELLALTWADVDLATGDLAITKGRGLIGGVQPPKTAKGRRVLPLDAERVALLKELRARHAELYGFAHAREGWIVVNEAGRPMRPEDWSARWRALCVATPGVRDDHTLHAARHSTVTFMRNAGVADHIVAAWHGHDEVVMRQTYSHAHAEQLKSAGSALSFGA
jgi:integrase